MAKKKSTNSMLLMLALIAAIIAVMIFLPSCGGNTPKMDAEAEATTIVKAGMAAPDFTVGMVDGTATTLSELRGNVVLVNFFATWCPPCREEMSRAQRDLVDRFAGRNFRFLPISREEDRATVEAFRQKTGYTFPMGLDTARTAYDLYASNFIPRNFLIDKDGKVIWVGVGYEPEEFDALLETIEKNLD